MSDLKKNVASYGKNLRRAAKDKNVRTAIHRATNSYRDNLNKALERYPHTPALAEEVKEIKLAANARWHALMEEAMEAIRGNNGQAYFAKDGDEVADLIEKIVGKPSEMVKAKTMLGEEIHLRKRLEEKGHTVWETDLGEFILQLMDEKPMHILSPAIHVPREQVADLFSDFFGKEVPPDIETEVGLVREFLREKYFTADVGISGTNVVAADTGMITIIENEGNIRLTTGAPPIHIAVVGIEKLVPTFQDAMKVAEVTWRYGQYGAPAYLNSISGPSKTGDIEKVTTYGAHGPKEFHVIFVDNGRSKMMADPVSHEAALCLRCGGCMYECPVFSIVAGDFGSVYMNGIGAVWTEFVEGLEAAAPIAYNCLRCGRCIEQCPMSIDIPTMMAKIRSEATEDL